LQGVHHLWSEPTSQFERQRDICGQENPNGASQRGDFGPDGATASSEESRFS
jgi:hypothetical protein